MGTILVREIFRQASFLLEDTAPQFHRFVQRDMIDALNDAQRMLATYIPPSCSRVDVLRLVAGVRQSIAAILPVDVLAGDGIAPDLPVRGTLLLDPIRNMGPDGVTPGRPVRAVPRHLVEAENPNWSLPANAGTRVESVMYDPATPKVFFVAPPVPATRLWIELSYNALPATIPDADGDTDYGVDGDAAATIGVGDEYATDCVNYVVARMNMQDQQWANPAKAAAFASMVLSSVNARAEALTGHNPNLKWLPFAPSPAGVAR